MIDAVNRMLAALGRCSLDDLAMLGVFVDSYLPHAANGEVAEVMAAFSEVVSADVTRRIDVGLGAEDRETLFIDGDYLHGSESPPDTRD